MEETVLISLGSNIGDKRANLERAVALMDGLENVRVLESSRMYRTAPVGGIEQDDYLNMAVRAVATVGPLELLLALKGVEARMGRCPSPRNYPRIIDLDIVFYGELVMTTERLTVPHPRAHERMFVIEPLNDIAPETVHPVLRKTVREILYDLKETKGDEDHNGA